MSQDGTAAAPVSEAPVSPIAARFRGFLPVIVDVETGGFNCATDALLEMAAVFVRFNAAGDLDLAERQGDDKLVHLPIQRNDIADYLGLTFETVSRILRFLKDQGMIRLRSVTQIEILDLGALQDMCD